MWSMVVMADEVFDVLVTHDAVYRREPERNARQQRANVSRVNLGRLGIDRAPDVPTDPVDIAL